MNPANKSAPNFANFISALQSQDVRPPSGVPALQQTNNGSVLVVPTIQSEGADDDCWFNAVVYSNRNPDWLPLFGWALWDVGDRKFVAQHHAIVNKGIEYFDVSLSTAFSNITFFIDNRVPFDYDKFRTPFNFEYSPDGCLWFAGEVEKWKYSIACIDRPNEYVCDQIAKARLRGVI